MPLRREPNDVHPGVAGLGTLASEKIHAAQIEPLAAIR
jgi:hypothetical protein